MFKFLLQSIWEELKPALILYSVILGGMWLVLEAPKLLN